MPNDIAASLTSYTAGTEEYEEEITDRTEVEDEELPVEQEAAGWGETETTEQTWLNEDSIEEW
jgi:hypothetical protein